MNNPCKIRHLVVGEAGTNCYIVYSKGAGRGVVIDPAFNGESIIQALEELQVRPEAILLTHGHFDHIMAADALKNKYDIPAYIHREDQALAMDPSRNAAGLFGQNGTFFADHTVEDADVLSLAGFSFQVIATPGHTAGSVCYYLKEQGLLFCGDTLFAQSVGRTDLPTGSYSQLIRSVREKLFLLPDETRVFPGHMASTTIGYEKKHNPFL